MMIWKCEDCGAEFDEPEVEYECAEALYGVSSYFDNSNTIPMCVCPECGSAEIKEEWKEYEDD